MHIDADDGIGSPHRRGRDQGDAGCRRGGGPRAIIANLTGISGTLSTFLELYPADAPSRPGSSDLNPAAHDVIANLDIVALSTSTNNGNVDLFNSVGTINVVIDVAGWFQ